MSRQTELWWKLARFLARRQIAVGTALFLLGMATAWYFWGKGDSGAQYRKGVSVTPASASESETVWTCSMHPQIRKEGPGRCPVCAMPLIPVAKASGGLRTLR